MSWVMVDIEADGPAPGLYSMIQLGAVIIDKEGKFDKTFFGQLRPISDDYVQSALDVTKLTRRQTEGYENPRLIMYKFRSWLSNNVNGQPMFISDNNGFDWQFVNYYCWLYLESNPFGHSSTNLGSLYKGIQKDFFTSFKKLRKTKHTHNPVDDCVGNCEALLYMINEMGLKMKLG